MRTWTSEERKLIKSLRSPFDIQCFLDKLPYNIDKKTRSPRGVMETRRAHCFDGAMFAAAMLEELGSPPLLIDLRANELDDDHILAVFRKNGCWGAVAKSNYTGGRYRDPVFRSLRELAMSYFVQYFNLAGNKTLREYSLPFDLRKVTEVEWRSTDMDLDFLSPRLDSIRHYRLITPAQERLLAPADERSFRAETLGLDPRGAFKVSGARLL